MNANRIDVESCTQQSENLRDITSNLEYREMHNFIINT
jgi:hypothetical protein